MARDISVETGAGEGTRTPNHLFTRQVRCQLRHAGDVPIVGEVGAVVGLGFRVAAPARFAT